MLHQNKFFAAVLVPMILLGAGCAQSGSFEKKQACSSRLPELQKDNSNIREVFYSPKTDSCVYTEIETGIFRDDPGANGVITDYALVDLFSNEVLFKEKGCDGELHCGSLREDAMGRFDVEVEKYR